MGKRIVIIVDCSGSMRGEGFTKALAFIHTVLTSPSDEWEVAVIAFDNSAYVRDWQEMPDADAVEEIEQWISDHDSDNTTFVAPALIRAKRMEADCALVVSDGMFYDNPEVIRMAALSLRMPVWSYFIGKINCTFKSVAESTEGGCYVEAGDRSGEK